MTELEKYLFDEYKRLDAICRDMFSCQHGISEYIHQMEQTPVHMQCQIPTWDKDFRNLKRLRWLRNQIAHETSTTDCTMADIEQLKNFYARILKQQDPLAVLGKIKRESPSSSLQKRRVVSNLTDISGSEDGNRQSPPHKAGCSFLVISVALFVISCAVFLICF